MAAVCGVEVVKQIARGGGVVAISNHVIVDRFVRQSHGGHPYAVACVGDVLGVSGVALGQSSLHGCEVVVEAVEAVAVPVPPRHEQHGFSTFVFDGVADVDRGILALLPHQFCGRERRHLTLVLKDDVIPV